MHGDSSPTLSSPCASSLFGTAVGTLLLRTLQIHVAGRSPRILLRLLEPWEDIWSESQRLSGHETTIGLSIKRADEIFTPVCVGHGPASGLTSCRSTCCSAPCCTWLLRLKRTRVDPCRQEKFVTVREPSGRPVVLERKLGVAIQVVSRRSSTWVQVATAWTSRKVSTASEATPERAMFQERFLKV